MRKLLLITALFASGLFAPAPASAQAGGLQPHNLYSSTRDRADMATMRRLNACGIEVAAEDSNFYEGLAEGFYVVISEPLRTRAVAEAQLEKARACGVTGQTRMVRRRIAAH